MQLVSKISNICDPDPPSQTDRQTTCNLNSCGKRRKWTTTTTTGNSKISSSSSTALHSLYCADVPLRNCSHTVLDYNSSGNALLLDSHDELLSYRSCECDLTETSADDCSAASPCSYDYDRESECVVDLTTLGVWMNSAFVSPQQPHSITTASDKAPVDSTGCSGVARISWQGVRNLIRPGFSRTVLYFWVLSWISRCPGFVLDLKSSEWPFTGRCVSFVQLDGKLHEIWSVDSQQNH